MTEPDERTARRASIRHLLDRAERGALLPAETAMLRGAVEVEQYNADHTDADTEQQLAEARHRIRILTAVDEGRAAGAQRIINERDQLRARAEQANGRAARAEERTQQAETVIARVRALATDMRTWCSPHGIATDYADRIEQALDEPCACGHTRTQHTAGPTHTGCDYCTGCTGYRDAEPDTPEPAAEPDKPVSLGTPCKHCGHPRNHHPCGGPCCFGNGCCCPAFAAAKPVSVGDALTRARRAADTVRDLT